MSDPIILTRDKVKREWSDFEPKLVAAILSGAGSGIIIAIVTPIATKAGIVLTPEIQAQIPLAIAGFIGWLTPSVGTTVTKKMSGNGTVSETHSGNPVTTVTAPTKIIRPAPPMGEPQNPDPNSGGAASAVTNTTGDSVTQILAGTANPDPNSEPTVAYTRGAGFLSRLPSSNQLTEE